FPWFWRSSQENQGGKNTFVQNNDINGDNLVFAGLPLLLSPLTSDLGPSTIGNFAVQAFATPTTTTRPENVLIPIQANNLGAGGGACQPLVYLICQALNKKANETLQEVIPVTNVAVAADGKSLTGLIKKLPDPPNDDDGNKLLGPYTLKVFIGDKVQTLA